MCSRPLQGQHEGVTIIGPRADQARIPGIDTLVGDNDAFSFGSHEVRVFDVPGHTRGHIAFWIPSADALFPGRSSSPRSLVALLAGGVHTGGICM